MVATMEKERVALRFGGNGEIIDGMTGELLGYAPGYDPGITSGIDTDALGEPFPPSAIKQREGGGGKMFSYVSTDTVIRRLNKATNNNWSFEIVHASFLDATPRKDRNGNVITDQKIHVVHGRLTIPGRGARDGFGVQVVDWPIGVAMDLLKAAPGDALKRAAVSFGVAIDLYGADLEAHPTQTAPPQPQQPQQRPAAPQQAPRPPQQQQQQAPRQPQPRTGVDPASIPGVVRGVANAKPPAPYEEYFDQTTRMDAIREYMGSFTPPIVAYGQQNMNDCRKAVNQWIQEHFQTPDAVKGTGAWNEQYKKYDLRPMDIGNALAHFAKQLSVDGMQEAASAAANDGDDGWLGGDDGPDGPPPY